MPRQSLDIADCDTPESLPALLRRAADRFREDQGELSSAWQDRNAGRVWGDFATILERAARSCDTAIAKRIV